MIAAIFILLIIICSILIKNSFTTVSLQKQQVKSLIESPMKSYVVYNVSYGSRVHKGQLVAVVDPTVCRKHVKQDLINLKYEKEQYKRYKFLSRVNASAIELFEKVEKAYGDSVTKLHIDQAVLRHCYQYAPFNGKVTEIVTSSGSGVKNGGVILGIVKIC